MRDRSMSIEQAFCELCGEPMPEGETMFKYHGYSGPCPKPPLPRQKPRDPHQGSMRVFIEQIASGNFPGASSFALADITNYAKLQESARAALARPEAQEGTER